MSSETIEKEQIFEIPNKVINDSYPYITIDDMVTNNIGVKIYDGNSKFIYLYNKVINNYDIISSNSNEEIIELLPQINSFIVIDKNKTIYIYYL